MELSKEVYTKSPEKMDVQSVVKDLMQDEKIVGKKKIQKKTKTKRNQKKTKKTHKRNPEGDLVK